MIGAIQEQGRKLPYVAPGYATDVRAELSRSLLEVLPRGLEKFFFSTSGTEANALAQELFVEPSELALSHKLALVLKQAAKDHPDWRLPELTAELGVVAKNERRFLGFGSDDSGFDPDRHRGKVLVSTMHKSKGLEWDRVYLMSVNNYDFPSGMQNDQYISEKWFAKDRLNLEAEATAQLLNALSRNEFEWHPEGEATQRARIDYIRERLRLFYVGITRAKCDLIITWNSGRNGDLNQSLPFAALQAWWESQPGQGDA